MKPSCFTIGHSLHDTSKFIGLLKCNKINCIIDVRSVPYSERAPQFNREQISLDLKKENVTYIYLGDYLGARYNDSSLLFKDCNIVDFKKVRELEKFQAGIARVLDGMEKGYIIALMCAEKNPYDCHRFVLISHELSKQDVSVGHILEDGTIKLNKDLEEELLKKSKLEYNQQTLFGETISKEEAIELAYEKRNKEIGYKKDN